MQAVQLTATNDAAAGTQASSRCCLTSESLKFQKKQSCCVPTHPPVNLLYTRCKLCIIEPVNLSVGKLHTQEPQYTSAGSKPCDGAQVAMTHSGQMTKQCQLLNVCTHTEALPHNAVDLQSLCQICEQSTVYVTKAKLPWLHQPQPRIDTRGVHWTFA